MEIIAIIPARGGSKGIPQKNIVDFAGKPLIAWTIEQAKTSSLISKVYVSSDSPEILAVANNYGAIPILRTKEISGDKASSESALLHTLDQLREDPDLVVFLQATSPLRKPDDIDNAINQLIKNNADSLLSLTETQEFIWEKSEEAFKPLTYDLNYRCGHRLLKKLYYENGSIYVFKPEILRRYNNRLGGKKAVYLMESWQRADIDDYETFDWCLWVFRRNFSKMYG
jgi:N-acylneuraminate cytidylyltransferase